jgi:hypothetical protein
MLEMFFVHAQEVRSELLHRGESGRVTRAEVVGKWRREGFLARKVVLLVLHVVEKVMRCVAMNECVAIDVLLAYF